MIAFVALNSAEQPDHGYDPLRRPDDERRHRGECAPRALINAPRSVPRPAAKHDVLIWPVTSVKLFDPEENAAVLPGGLILALEDVEKDDCEKDDGAILTGKTHEKDLVHDRKLSPGRLNSWRCRCGIRLGAGAGPGR
ncbi:MAG: hypothetical protein ACXWJ8_07655 [Xanthobacteraceae bacterium]